MRTLLLALVMAALAADDAGTVRHVVPGCPLSLCTPTAWTVGTDTRGAALLLRSPDDGTVVISPDPQAAERARASVAVVAQPVAPGDDAAATFARSLDTLRRLAPAFTLIDQPTTVTIAGREWHRVRYRFRTGQLTWEQLLLASVIDRTACTVTCSSDDVSAARWAPVFENVVSSLAP